MQALREIVPGHMSVEKMGFLPDGAMKIKVGGVHEVSLEDIEEWRRSLRKDGWVETGILDMDEETLMFVCRRQRRNPWLYLFFLLLLLLFWRIYTKF